MMRSRRIQPWRKAALILQGVLFLSIPFVRIRGESVLRFDIPSLTLHFFGTGLRMDEFFIVLAALLLFIFLLVLVTLLFGRIWCGWACPQAALVDLTSFLEKRGMNRGIHRWGAYALILPVCILISAGLIWYFVSPYDFIRRLAVGEIGPVIRGFWIVLSVIVFLDLTTFRRTFCATVCPYSKLQGAISDENTMVIAFDRRREKECMDCRVCIRACPVCIDIRNGMNASCFNCAQCIDSCSQRMYRRDASGLIGYVFGSWGESARLLRPNAVIAAAAVVCSLVLLVYLSATRSTLEFTIQPNNDYSARISENGTVVNSFVLSIDNEGGTDAALAILARDMGNPVEIRPSEVMVKSGHNLKQPVYVLLKPKDRSEIEITLSGPSGLKVCKKVRSIMPEKRL